MTATWTTPKTWSSALVTSTDMNTHIRDNIDYLKARPVARVSDLDGTVSNTTSATLTDITGASVSITTSGSSRLLIIASGSWTPPNGQTAYITVDLDGTNLGDATVGMIAGNLANTQMPFALVHLTTAAVSDGAHTVKLRYMVTGAATVTVRQFNLAVAEVF